MNTLYPFGSTLAYTVTASKSLTFKIRIPQWAQTSGTSTIRHGRAQMEKLSVDDASMQSVKVKHTVMCDWRTYNDVKFTRLLRESPLYFLFPSTLLWWWKRPRTQEQLLSRKAPWTLLSSWVIMTLLVLEGGKWLEWAHNMNSDLGCRSDQALSDVERIYPNAPAAYLEPVSVLSLLYCGVWCSMTLVW